MSDPIVKGISTLARVGGDVALDFANTVHRYDREKETDELQTYADFVTWAVKVEIIPEDIARKLEGLAQRDARGTSHALTQIRSTRRAIYDVFGALAHGNTPDQSNVRVIQDFWIEALREARLEWGGNQADFQFDVGGRTLNEPLFPIAHAAMQLFLSDDAGRVRSCHADDCTWLFVDRSKNASRRWCQMEVCGNREKAKRHYRRAKSAS